MNCFKKAKNDGSLLMDLLMPVVLFLIILLVFINGLNSVSKKAEEEQFNATKQAVTRAVVHCYALEGCYPSSIQYLENNYGLAINHNKYIVDYNCFASNLMPEITVLKAKK